MAIQILNRDVAVKSCARKAELDLVICNHGDTPTFERGDNKSFMDVTETCSTMNKEALTYHHYILVEVGLKKGRKGNSQNHP